MPLELQLVLVFIVSILSGVASGISGGGAGLVVLPALLAVGLPAQIAIATMKMGGLGASLGGLSVFHKSGHIRTDILKVMIPIAVAVGLVTPFIFQKIDSEVFETVLGWMLILMVPTLFIKKQLTPSRHSRLLGYSLYAIVLVLVALFSAGIGFMGIFILIMFFGTSKLQANATKRAIMAVQVPITFVGLLVAGFVSLPHGLALLIGSYLGTQFGSKIAIKKGEEFVTVAMAIVTVATGVYLLLS